MVDATAFAPATSRPLGDVWSVVDPDGAHPVTQIRLLETPPSWQQQTNPDSLLTAFGPDREYSLWSSTTDPTAGIDAGVRFTLADLKSLSDGEVWAEPKPFAQARAMTREEFRQRAAASC